MTAFVQSEFAERCQRLINWCNKADTALLVNHPDSEKLLNEVSKDWVNFYLSHGNASVQPPNMSFIAPEIWNNNLKKLGNSFSDYIHKNQNSNDHQKMLLKIYCFKNEESLQNLHNSFKASELCERDFKKISNLEDWFECRFQAPFELVYAYIQPYQELLNDLNIEIETQLAAFNDFYNDFPKLTDDVKQSYFNNINDSISESLLNWEKFFMYK